METIILKESGSLTNEENIVEHRFRERGKTIHGISVRGSEKNMSCRYKNSCGHYRCDGVTCNNDREAVVYCGIAKRMLGISGVQSPVFLLS